MLFRSFGTNRYASPEMRRKSHDWRHKDPGFPTDIYSFGVVANNMLLKDYMRVFFAYRDMKDYTLNSDQLDDWPTVLKQPVQEFIEGLLKVDPDGRFTVEEVEERLEDILATIDNIN